ncbi:hypothetical protein EVAR_78494_1 [Eumeta japonica]|uniref:Uncharacterized protein n=1 Tax=Eumeta variegata TaxID=151549 RepID=A0A4C1TYA1_EUMVA|nr:hypothetical protein EVAR_78494_1 [Eumeta japonica]
MRLYIENAANCPQALDYLESSSSAVPDFGTAASRPPAPVTYEPRHDNVCVRLLNDKGCRKNHNPPFDFAVDTASRDFLNSSSTNP